MSPSDGLAAAFAAGPANPDDPADSARFRCQAYWLGKCSDVVYPPVPGEGSPPEYQEENDLDEKAEAAKLFREALELHRQALGDTHQGTLTVLYNFTRLMTKTSAFEEAESMALECERLNRVVHGDGHPETKSAVDLVVTVYEAWHAAEPDADCDIRAAAWREKLTSLEDEGRPTTLPIQRDP